MNRFPEKNECGIALVLVLWIIALLTIIAGEFCYVIRTEANITRNFKEETQAYYIAVSGLFWAIEGLVADEHVPRRANLEGDKMERQDIRWRMNRDIPPIPFGEGQFKVERENESGKVNLNGADHSLLVTMLHNLEIADADKDIILDSIMDWRDEDDLPRANGAENRYYLSLPKPYKCKNGDFTSVEELLLVRGMTPELFHGGLKDIFAAYQHHKKGGDRDSGKKTRVDYRRLNINAAPPVVLRALPFMTEKVVQDILKYRAEKDFRALSDLYPVVGSDIYEAIWPYIMFNLSPYYKIKSVGLLNGSQNRREVQAIVKIDRTIAKGYEIIQWIDSPE